MNDSRLTFQPGEASWASWKSGGGVHRDASDVSSPQVFKPLADNELACTMLHAAISYDGTETGYQHVTPRPQHTIPECRIELIA